MKETINTDKSKNIFFVFGKMVKIELNIFLENFIESITKFTRKLPLIIHVNTRARNINSKYFYIVLVKVPKINQKYIGRATPRKKT